MQLNALLARYVLASALLLLSILLPEFAAGHALDVQDAKIDQEIQRKLFSPQTGPELSLELHKIAKNNQIDPYGLAKEACKIMASNVQDDLCRFSLSYEEKQSLNRLWRELIQNENQGCHYRDWVRLSAKFCIMTGFIRYRQNPDQYAKEFASTNEPSLDTSLCELEQLPWGYINDVLAGEERTAPDDYSIFGQILFYLHMCVEYGSFVFPGFQGWNLKSFICVACHGFFPAGVFLGDRILADGGWFSRGMFFMHDIAHAGISAFRWCDERGSNTPSSSENELLNQMRNELGMVDYLYSRKDQIDAFEEGIFKAIELILFIESHEGSGFGFLYCLNQSQSKTWRLMYNANNRVVYSFEKGQFEDLEPEYGCCCENIQLLHLAAIYLMLLSEQRCLYADFNLEGFKRAVDLCLDEFNEKRQLYNVLDSLARDTTVDAEAFIAGWSPQNIAPQVRRTRIISQDNVVTVSPVKKQKLSDFIVSQQSRQWLFGTEAERKKVVSN